MEGALGSLMDIMANSCVPMVLKAAIELGVLEILANAGPESKLSASEIASQLPTTNPSAGVTLDRILHLLASNSILSSTRGPSGERHYGLTPMCSYLLRSEDGISCAPMILMNLDKVPQEGWYYLKDAVLEGCVPFVKAHGKTTFQYFSQDARLSKLFNESMFGLSMNYMRDVLENYRGFGELKEIVDVGGGTGASLRVIISKYPHIRGINFDLPYVIANAPSYPGVKHVGGDMFEGVPSGEAILIKTVLHDWDDESCVKILKNCWKVLPDSGKVILVEFVLPSDVTTDPVARRVISFDLMMLAVNDGGKERTFQEFEALAKAAGFPAIAAFPCSSGMSVIELHKNPE